jgi:hypothetical protein
MAKDLSVGVVDNSLHIFENGFFSVPQINVPFFLIDLGHTHDNLLMFCERPVLQVLSKCVERV